jgi:hypothetical protein
MGAQTEKQGEAITSNFDGTVLYNIVLRVSASLRGHHEATYNTKRKIIKYT